MKTKIHSQSGFLNPRILVAFAFGSVGVLLAMVSFAANPPHGMKTPSASSAGASVFVDNQAIPFQDNLAAPASGMPLSATGAGWSIVTSPNASTTKENQLFGVTCASASDCWAVGDYLTDNFYYQTVIEHWNGAAWSIVRSPNTSATQDNLLRGVTCTSASDCWAVGSYDIFSGNGFYYRTLIEHWNGAAWSIVTSPNASARQDNELQGVTCTSASDCWAVGSYNLPDYSLHTLVEHWNGAAWSIVLTNITQENVPFGITCTSASDCWAVGYWGTTDNIFHTFAAHWNGAAWSFVTSPNTSTTQPNRLDGVTCSSASDCWAVGEYSDDDNVDHTLIEHWNGVAWSIVTSPNTSATEHNRLFGVTCTSASDCWAVGHTFFTIPGGNNVIQTLVEHWNGAAWSIVTSPNHTTPTPYDSLYGVTCTSASDCWAVGASLGDNAYQTLIERYTPIAPGRLGNISTRAFVETGDNVTIGGFIVQGTQPKRMIIRAIGPELTQYGVPDPLANPTLELHDGTGALIASNNNWGTTIIRGIITANQVQDIRNSGYAPRDELESAIIADLAPGNYTAIMRGVNNMTGVGLVELYDLSPDRDSILGNISTRSFVQTGDNAMIGGFIVQGTRTKRVIIRAIGPELAVPPYNVRNTLANPTLELHDGMGALIASNNDWETTIIGGIITANQVQDIRNSGYAPTDGRESAIIGDLPAGNYTAIVRGVDNMTGVALVEVYDLDR